MKKENMYKFLYVVSVLLMTAFVIRLGIDYFKYEEINNSAPFYAFIIERTIEFVLPSMIIFTIGKVIKKKYHKR